MRIAKLFFGLACMAAFAACTNDDELLTNEVSQPHAMSFTLSTGADTRTALAEPTDKTGTYSLTRTWKEGDAVEVCYSTDEETMTHETFTLTAGAGTTSGTFSNDASTIPTTGEVKLNIITKAGNFTSSGNRVFANISTQGDGSITSVGDYEIIRWYNVTVTDGVWSFPEPDSGIGISVGTLILHLPAGFPVYEASSDEVVATADLKLSAFGFLNSWSITFPGSSSIIINIESESEKLSLTGIQLKGGKLAADVYMAVVPGAVESTFSLIFTVGEEEYTVKLKDPTSELEAGNVYHLDAADIVEEEVALEVGMVIGSDGKYYADKAAAEAVEGVTAEAMIAYLGKVDGVCDTGLAIALEDVGNANDEYTWDASGTNNGNMTAAEIVVDWASYHPINGDTSGWRLPSAYDWQHMFQGCGGDTYTEPLTNEMAFSHGDFRTKLKAAGGDSADMQSNYYWSSTEYNSDLAWYYNFFTGKFWWFRKSGNFSVRAVLAF